MEVGLRLMAQLASVTGHQTHSLLSPLESGGCLVTRELESDK
jgi:hypothetical protein